MSQSHPWIGPLAESFVTDIEIALAGYVEILEPHVGSPIELQLVVAIWAGLRFQGLDAVLVRNGSEVDKFDEACKGHDFALALQYPWRKYRSDICFGGNRVGQRILVECDGHDFHERTKTQAAHDRRRDMLAQQDGYHIIRFTGSQIFASPYNCTFDLLNFVATRAPLQKGVT